MFSKYSFSYYYIFAKIKKIKIKNTSKLFFKKNWFEKKKIF